METITSEETPTLYQHALRWGAIVGAISIALTLIFYVVDYSFLADWKVGIFMIVIYLGLVIYSGITYRNEIGGFLAYGKAFQHGFIVMAVAGFINVLFQGILFSAIDPELPQKLTEATIESTARMMEGFGAPEEQIDKQLDTLKEEMPARFSFVGQLKAYPYGLILYVIISSITSLFVRKNEPEMI
jgi:hypothetical protein